MSADQGDFQALRLIWSMYFHGKGVTQKYAQAFKYGKMLADQGDAQAQLSIANMYHNGKGVEQSDAEALNIAKCQPIKDWLRHC